MKDTIKMQYLEHDYEIPELYPNRDRRKTTEKKIKPTEHIHKIDWNKVDKKETELYQIIKIDVPEDFKGVINPTHYFNDFTGVMYCYVYTEVVIIVKQSKNGGIYNEIEFNTHKVMDNIKELVYNEGLSFDRLILNEEKLLLKNL